MSNPVATISAITALLTALGTVLTIILHIRNHDAKSQASTELPPSAKAYDVHSENQPYSPPDTPPGFPGV